MAETSSISESLLDGLRRSRPDAWPRFLDLSSPMVYRKCRAFGFSHHDAEEVTQDVFRRVHRAIGGFQRNGRDLQFRKWLSVIIRTTAIDHLRMLKQRAEGPPVGGEDYDRLLHQLEAESDEPDGLEITDDDLASIMRRAMDAIEHDFEPLTWQVFLRVAVDERSARDVADEFGKTPEAVRQIKSRILKRLKEELDGMI